MAVTKVTPKPTKFTLGPSFKQFYPSFCNIRLSLNSAGTPQYLARPPVPEIRDLRAISYHDLQRSELLFGVASTPLARTGRTVTAVAELELGLVTYQSITQQLTAPAGATKGWNPKLGTEPMGSVNNAPSPGPLGSNNSNHLGGFGDFDFDLTVSYQLKPGDAVLTDTLYYCRILGSHQQASSSGRSISVRVPLSVGLISWGGCFLTEYISA